MGGPSLLQSLQEELRKAEALLGHEGPSLSEGSPLPADWAQQQQQAVAHALEEMASGGPGASGGPRPEVDKRLQLLLQRAAEGPGEGGPHLMDVSGY